MQFDSEPIGIAQRWSWRGEALETLMRDRLSSLAHAFAGLCACYAVYAHLTMPVLPFDDAYITFRYVRQLFDGNGLVYNAGQRVLGVSTPLMLLWSIALGMFSGSDLPAMAVRLNVVFFLATALGLYLIMRRVTERATIPAVLTGLFLVNQRLLAISGGGMESFLYTALVLFALLAATDDREVIFGLLAALAILARPEGAFLIVAGLVAFARTPRKLLVSAAAGAIPLLLWLSFAKEHYGSIVPQSVIAKARPIYLLPPYSTLEELLYRCGRYVTGYSLGHNAASLAVGVASLILFLCACLLAVSRGKAARVIGTGAAALFLGTCAMYSVENVLIFDWYTPGLQLMFMTGIVVAGLMIARRAGASTAGSFVNAALIMWFVLLSLPPGHAFGGRIALVSNGLDLSGWRSRVVVYRQAAQWINAHARPGDRMAAPEIGALGYYWQGDLLDSCGLVSPEALPFLPIRPDAKGFSNDGAFDPEFVRATGAQWVASADIFMRRLAMPDPWFQQHYELVQTLPLRSSEFGAKAVLIYRARKTS
jgi:hypothetical protein